MKNEKHLEALTAVKDGDMMAIGSTEDEDRVGDVLKVSDWDLSNLKRILSCKLATIIDHNLLSG